MSDEVQAGPVVKVARDLSEIRKLAVALEAQAVSKASDRLMPGGLAMVSLAADADLDQWAERIAAAELRHFEGPNACPKANHTECVIHGAEHVEDEDDQDAEDPLRSLLWWSEERRERYGYPLDGRQPTLLTETAFLRWALDAMWRDEPRWQDFADDVNHARRSLESMLSAGQRAQRTRVPCQHCEKAPMLIKVHAERKQVGVCCVVCNTIADMTERERCPVCWTHAPAAPLWASDERDDWWKCPSCKRRYDRDAFMRTYEKHLRSEGAQKFVPLADAVAVLRSQGRPERTIRKWLADTENPVETGMDDHGRRTVWWPDLWTRHLTTQTRQRSA